MKQNKINRQDALEHSYYKLMHENVTQRATEVNATRCYSTSCYSISCHPFLLLHFLSLHFLLLLFLLLKAYVFKFTTSFALITFKKNVDLNWCQ